MVTLNDHGKGVSPKKSTLLVVQLTKSYLQAKCVMLHACHQGNIVWILLENGKIFDNFYPPASEKQTIS